MKTIINLLFVFILVLLTGCSVETSTVLPIPTTVKPTEKIAVPTATKHPTQTPKPCAPHLDTKLPEPNTAENYKGMVFRFPYPEELEIRFGGLIGGNIKGAQYAFTHVRNQNNNQDIFWFERMICRNIQGKAFSEIIDALFLSLELEQQEVVYTGSCKLNGAFDVEIIAVGDRLPYSEKLQNIRQAWRANRQTETIGEIPVNAIECYRESGIRVP